MNTYLISPLIGFVGVLIGSVLTFLIQSRMAVNADIKELRNRLIYLLANLEAYEYLMLAQSEDYHRAAYLYALTYTSIRLIEGLRNSSSKAEADRLELLRENYETTVFEFRKLISEFRTLSSQREQLELLLVPLYTEEFDKWNFMFNAMSSESELKKYFSENREDLFGQGGTSIEPTNSVKRTKSMISTQFGLIYSLIDNQINKLLPKEIKK